MIYYDTFLYLHVCYSKSLGWLGHAIKKLGASCQISHHWVPVVALQGSSDSSEGEET